MYIGPTTSFARAYPLAFLLLGACGAKIAPDGAGDAGPVGQLCSCATDDAGIAKCSPCPAGLVCFAARGICTHTCTKAAECPAVNRCEKSAYDDYATGPWCL